MIYSSTRLHSFFHCLHIFLLLRQDIFNIWDLYVLAGVVVAADLEDEGTHMLRQALLRHGLHHPRHRHLQALLTLLV